MANTKRLYTGPNQKLICTACREEKSVNEFGIRKDTKVPRVKSICRRCMATRQTAKNQASDEISVYWWARQLMKYGLTPETWNELFNSQGLCCAICGADENGAKRFHVDHCHDTGVIRGILCTKCNVGIGALRDDSDLVMRAFLYLENFSVVAERARHEMALKKNVDQ